MSTKNLNNQFLKSLLFCFFVKIKFTSSNFPVLIDQTNILNVSNPPAHTTSPAASNAIHEN
jgi:hypothetical protein